jgi:Single-stranded DNA-binding protein
MSTFFIGTGNIGTDPELKIIKTGSNESQVLSFRVFFDNPVKLDDGSFEERGGFWAKVEMWPRTGGEDMARLYQKGQRVLVQGQRLVQEEWKDKETNEDRTGLKVQARYVGILPVRLESIVMKSKTNGGDEFDEMDDLPF